MVSHYDFELHFPVMLVLFHVLIHHLYAIFGKMSTQVLCPFLNFFFLIKSYMSSLFTVVINPLLEISFENIFSNSVDFPFIF